MTVKFVWLISRLVSKVICPKYLVNLAIYRGVPRIFGGGVPRSAKQANKPNKRATELNPRTCAHQGSMFRSYTTVCFVESSIFMALV